MNSPIKVVLDTNIFINARFKREGVKYRIINDCIDGVLQALYTDKLKAEAERMLDKFGASAIYKNRVKAYFYAATYVENPVDLKVCEDPADDMFLECAVSGEANYIISDDQHLLALECYEGIKIRAALQFYTENNIPKAKKLQKEVTKA